MKKEGRSDEGGRWERRKEGRKEGKRQKRDFGGAEQRKREGEGKKRERERQPKRRCNSTLIPLRSCTFSSPTAVKEEASPYTSCRIEPVREAAGGREPRIEKEDRESVRDGAF